jgi:hypothetical protein
MLIRLGAQAAWQLRHILNCIDTRRAIYQKRQKKYGLLNVSDALCSALFIHLIA